MKFPVLLPSMGRKNTFCYNFKCYEPFYAKIFIHGISAVIRFRLDFSDNVMRRKGIIRNSILIYTITQELNNI